MIHLLFKIIVCVLIVGLFLYSKLLPYKDRLDGNSRSTFSFFEKLFTPLLELLRKVSKPTQVGMGLSVDMSQIVLLVIFLLLLNMIR